MNHVRVFGNIAYTQPQLAYNAVLIFLQREQTLIFLLRVLHDCGALFRDLECSLASCFLPALFAWC